MGGCFDWPASFVLLFLKCIHSIYLLFVLHFRCSAAVLVLSCPTGKCFHHQSLCVVNLPVCVLVSRCLFVCFSLCVPKCVCVCTNSTVICRRDVILNAACVISSRDNKGNDVADTYETGFMHKHADCRKRRARAAGEPGYKEDVRMCACPHASLPGPL